MAPSDGNLKRKRPNNSNQTSRKRPSAHDARAISAQTTGRAFGNGGIDADKFVRAREFEIKALETSMRRSKQSLNTRAFQHVPREMRRRTASHNVKRVPKRLQARAQKEKADDNTPTVNSKTRKKATKLRLRLDTVKRLKALSRKKARSKLPEPDANGEAGAASAAAAVNIPPAEAASTNGMKIPRIRGNVLHKPPQPKAKFRKRQIHKAWLPTHLFHAKRAHMTPPSKPLWRMAIPMSPTIKSYRPTHRASNVRGAIAWDTSYMSTIRLEGTQASLQALLKELGFERGLAAKDSNMWKRWLAGTRYLEGWLYRHEGWPTKAIAPLLVVWQAIPQDHTNQGSSDKIKAASRSLMVRVQPAAFLQVWEEILPLARAQKPAVTLQDLRYEIGSIEMMGTASAEILTKVLRPSTASTLDPSCAVNETNDIWDIVQVVSNPSLLPPNAVIALDAVDPRLRSKSVMDEGQSFETKPQQQLLETLADWPINKHPKLSGLFDRACRWSACRQMPSPSAIKRRKTILVSGEEGIARTDPSIPILVLPKRGSGRSAQGTWILMMPWKYVLPIWYCLMYERMSTGGTIRFGGLDERRQTLFETGQPWFPGDFPGTTAGQAWEDMEAGERRVKWQKRPKGKRVEFEKLSFGNGEKGEIGNGWACDWRRLLRRNDDSDTSSGCPWQIPTSLARISLQDPTQAPPHGLRDGLITIRLEMPKGGVPSTCARIYRLPEKDRTLRKRWLSLLSQTPTTAPTSKRKKSSYVSKDTSPHSRRQHLAASLLHGPELEQTEAQHPPVPLEEDLIGFVTTGNFNLGEGMGSGVGCILLEKVLAVKDSDHHVLESMRSLCIVRNSGHVTGRIARWELILN